MFSTLNRIRGPVFAPDGDGGGAPAGDAAPAAAPADTGSVLYPDDKPAGEGAPVKSDDAPAGEWKEYVPDASKSDEENAAAKAEHDKSKPAEADPADKVPEDGKYDLKMPEGVELDQALLDAVAPEFKASGLTTKQAQALTDKFIAIQQERETQRATEWETTKQGWVDQAKKDPEMGGAKWDETARVASGLVKRHGNDAFREYLNSSGAGNHPEMIRFMAKVGAMMSEDTPATAAPAGKPAPQDRASIMYPDDQPKR